jgi:hypothetical protein
LASITEIKRHISDLSHLFSIVLTVANRISAILFQSGNAGIAQALSIPFVLRIEGSP